MVVTSSRLAATASTAYSNALAIDARDALGVPLGLPAVWKSA